jgi:hypothetical protein
MCVTYTCWVTVPTIFRLFSSPQTETEPLKQLSTPSLPPTTTILPSIYMHWTPVGLNDVCPFVSDIFCTISSWILEANAASTWVWTWDLSQILSASGYRVIIAGHGCHLHWARLPRVKVWPRLLSCDLRKSLKFSVPGLFTCNIEIMIVNIYIWLLWGASKLTYMNTEQIFIQFKTKNLHEHV